jgi:hypothetical protein
MKEDYTDSLINVWLEQVDLVQADLTYRTLMVKLNNYSGADMTKELNDVYGKTDLDYVNEFNEFDAEPAYLQTKVTECQKECNNELNTGGCQSS